MGFEDLANFATRATISLPISGKIYVVNDVDAETGTWASLLANRTNSALKSGEDVDASRVAALILDDEEERNLYQRLLGDTYEEMVADGVEWSWVKHAGTTVLIWVTNSLEAAEKVWASYEEAPGEAGARTPNRASRRASAAVARTTKKPASTSGTRAPKASAATARPGRTSSGPGTS